MLPPSEDLRRHGGTIDATFRVLVFRIGSASYRVVGSFRNQLRSAGTRILERWGCPAGRQPVGERTTRSGNRRTRRLRY